MRFKRTMIGIVVSAAALIIGAIGCTPPPPSGSGSSGGGDIDCETGELYHPDLGICVDPRAVDGPEDCHEGELYDPATATCIDDPRGPAGQCDEGQWYDADEEQCLNVDDEDASDCADGEVFNPVEERCVSADDAVQAPQDCAPDELFDPHNEICVGGFGDGSDDEVDDCGQGQWYDPDAGECIDDPTNGTTANAENDANDNSGDTNTANDGNQDNQDNQNNQNNDPYNSDQFGCGVGDLVVNSCAPDGTTLGGVEITLEGTDCDGDPFVETILTPNDGQFQFGDMPEGSYELTMSSGSFESVAQVEVIPGETTDLGNSVCFDSDAADIAILEGQYDEITELLDDRGLDYDVVGSDGPLGDGNEDAAQFLADIDAMNAYDILLIECGRLWADLEGALFDFNGDSWDIEKAEANIREFVESGNRLMVTDHAQPFVQKTIPEAVEFYQDIAGTSAPRAGQAGEYTADVVDSDMEDALGKTTVELSFDMAGFTIAEDGGGANSTVQFRADVPTDSETVDDAALMVTYDDASGGAAIFSSFHTTQSSGVDNELILNTILFQL